MKPVLGESPTTNRATAIRSFIARDPMQNLAARLHGDAGRPVYINRAGGIKMFLTPCLNIAVLQN